MDGMADELSSLRWQAGAACARPSYNSEWWFPEQGPHTKEEQVLIDKAKSICSRCEVRKACLDYAMSEDIRFGIWGGKTVNQRAKLKRLRRHGGKWIGS